jgi:hypothetical protein
MSKGVRSKEVKENSSAPTNALPLQDLMVVEVFYFTSSTPQLLNSFLYLTP